MPLAQSEMGGVGEVGQSFASPSHQGFWLGLLLHDVFLFTKEERKDEVWKLHVYIKIN